MTTAPKKIGLMAATALVIGNMIGAGIFVLPATLASYGGISILGWIFSAAGALILAKIFSHFSTIIVHKSGGPYQYSKAGFGDFIGFLVAWGYWISIWITNGATAIAIVGALSFFLPILNENPVYAVSTGLAFIWLFTFINSRGVNLSGRVQIITTVLKILPLVFIIVLGLFFFKMEDFPAFNLTEGSTFTTLSIVATLTLYAFLGIESATIPAASIKNPERTIPKATMIGTLLTTCIYILGMVVLFGILPADVFQNSPAPFAEAGKLIGGDWVGYFVAGGAAIAAIGALNGWILIMGQIPMATAQDRLFPKLFKRENKKGVPSVGLFLGSILSSLVMMMNYTEGLVKQFEFMILLSTLAVLVPYVFTSAAYAMIALDHKLKTKKFFQILILSVLGFAFSFWAIYGAGQNTVFYGFLLLLSGVPFYAIMKYNQSKKT